MKILDLERRGLFIFTLGLLFFTVAGITTWRWADNAMDAPGSYGAVIIVDFPRGTSLAEIAARLKQAGAIEHDWLFRMAAVSSGNAQQLKAGEYAFPPGASARMILEKIARGEIYLHRLGFAEGLSVKEILALIAAHEALTGEMPPPPPEGSLLPETYFFPRGETRIALIKRMQTAQRALLAELWAARAPDLPLNTPEEAVILASIVEKETAITAERPRIAGVFYNRLKVNMPLQSDPAVVYARDQGSYNPKPLSQSDLALENPYNTYLNTGLPPGPIAAPGKAALEAVLHPENTKALYFVADGSGGHAFAATLQEHNRNVAAYRALSRPAQ